jgi:energy-coupling factor transporter ATP-binding protein EcfA2
VSPPALDERLAALGEAAELADGRLAPERVAAARDVVARAGRRLGLGVEVTVAALAGPTGAGKSTLFNALAGADLTTAGRRRPTTSAATAAVWGDVGGALLDWLEVPRRHARPPEGGLDGLVLLDLPDFDSVEEAHRREMERVVGLADLVVWVVDPQKYADGALHDRYLRPLSGYADTMVVVVNQADLLDPDGVAAVRADLERLLERDGLPGVPVLAASARTGLGLDGLRELLEERVSAREAAVARLAADVHRRAAELDAGCGAGRPGEVGRADRERLVAALGEAAGAPGVVSAVERAHRRRGALATGSPYVRWLRRLRPDPLKRLHLADRGAEGAATSLPAPTPVQRARAAAAVRGLAAGAGGELPQPWPGLLRQAATAHEERLPDRLDTAVAGADLHMTRPRWWALAGLVQALLAVAALVGAVWLVVLAALGWLRIEDVLPVPEVEGIPVPTGLLIGGLVLGFVVALLARVVNGAGARRRARAARRALDRRVEAVAGELVVAPVEAELDARRRLCAALQTASAADGRRPARRLGARRAGVPA